MASSDAATSSGSDYQVFLSFRGPDTRVGFTDVLFYSLTDAGICVFRDDEELRVGERIDGSLLRAIDNSRIYIPIFSRNYASSQWCLRELAQIVANTFKSEGNKVILPIFFDVKPDDVKLKTPLYRDTILNLENEKKLSNELVKAWREALMKIDAIKGWEVKKYKGHGELIRMVVEEVVEKLKTKHRSVTEHLVGIDDQVAAISKLLDVNSDGVRLIKIHGMGGIGKTTLAKVVFNQFSSHFGKCCCFLEDVRAKSSKTDGVVDLQKRLLSEIGHPAGTRSINEIDYGMKRAGEVLGKKKVLIVLDDVDSNEQVEKLVGKSSFYSGSRILVTTRNKDVLQINTPKYQILDYEMEVMSADHALELFSKHALNRDSPLDDYNNLSSEIVYALGRLPLAIEVIGSFLYQKSQEKWKETLKKLRKAPDKNVFGKLKISYDALSFEQQQIFLDIACFFIGEDKTNASYMWKDCEFFPDTGVDVLVSMSLIKIVENNKFWMHDQLRDLGRQIVHQENPINPKERSRIWIWEEGLEALRSGELRMNNNVQALSLETSGRYPHNVVVRSEEIGRFEHLRFLKLSGLTLVGDATNHLTKLRWISLSYPPQIHKWITMSLNNVVVLELYAVDFLDDSRLRSLIKMASKLEVLSLKRCKNITRTPDFSGCPNLERLTFEDCSKLRKIDGSIGMLKCLIDLNINHCNSLKHLPEEIGDLVNLQYFFVAWNEIKELPSSIWKMKSLRELHFQGYIDEELDLANSWELPSAVGSLQNLEVLQVNIRSLKGELASGIGSLPFLRILNLSKTSITGIPKSINMLPRLQRIELVDCNMIQELPTLPTSLTNLEVSSASLLVIPDLSNLTNLVELDLSDGGGYVDHIFPPEKGVGDKLPPTGELGWIGKLCKLTKLSIRLHKVPIPTEMASLPLLNELALFDLERQTFPQLPLSVQKLSLDNVNIVGSLSPNLRNLSCLHIWRSPMQEIQLDGLQLPQLKELNVLYCGYLERLRLSRMRKLEKVKVVFCQKLVEIQFSTVFESLEALSIEFCESLERIVYESADELISCEGRLIFPSRVLSKLRNLALVGCHKILDIQVVGASESWEYLRLLACDHVQSLGGLANLKNLKFLNIEGCERLRVVEGVDELEFLVRLGLYKCGSLERLIEVSTTKLPNDCALSIETCRRLRGIKKRFDGSVQSLKHYKVNLIHSLFFSF
ncbi:disease resistance protein L6-like [Rhodamnia argentea]|uniref:Disease resistance protein L6-like n=1 Tax=Rhodamnia argentea TaxID=178133 RepID=A0ABM3HVZ5_9MYRT|nr:disease resistance protein L6-like [Rhodamnia argentea]